VLNPANANAAAANVTDFRVDENAGLHSIAEPSTLRAATTAGVGNPAIF